MSFRPPVPDAGGRLCPKCGMLQESIGSTVCEQCGADLIEAAQTKPVVSPVPPPIFSTQPPAVSSPQPASRPPRGVAIQLPAVSLHLLVRRISPILGLLLHRIGSILGALIRGLVAIPLWVLGGIVAAVQRVVSLILRAVSLVLRAVSLALRLAAMVLVVGGLVVGLSHVPAVHAAVPITKQVTVRSDVWRKQAQGLGSSLLEQLQQRVQLWPPPQQKPDVRTTRPSRSAASPKPPAPARRATSSVSLAITSTPPGATVLLNQRRIGKAPVTVKVAPGAYRLTVSHPGFLSVTRTVTVKAGQPTSLDIVLSQPP